MHGGRQLPQLPASREPSDRCLFSWGRAVVLYTRSLFNVLVIRVPYYSGGIETNFDSYPVAAVGQGSRAARARHCMMSQLLILIVFPSALGLSVPLLSIPFVT